MSAPADDARSLAVRAVARVLAEGSTLDAALDATLPLAPPSWSSAIRSLAYGAVRGYYRHGFLLARLLSQPVRSLEPALRALLSLALFELEDARTPEYAVVDAAVSLAKARGGRAGGLVNAVLRRYLRERRALDAELAKDPAARHAAPPWLAERLRADWPERWVELLAALDTRPPMWLRADPRRGTAAAYVEALHAAGMSARSEPRVPQALVLATPCDVARLPGFEDGVVSVQDLGAQCAAFPLALTAGLSVLDACAAPGGKTTLIAEREPHLSRLVAVDVDGARLERVRDNLTRGKLSAELIVADAGLPAGWWDGAPFDRILLDAPCSALGVVRRHPDIRLRRSPKEIERMPPLQARLLTAAWGLLARGGRLVYATCTMTRSENRGVIAAFLDATPDARLVPPEHWQGWPGLGVDDGFGRQILPGEAGADGFYYAALTKR